MANYPIYRQVKGSPLTFIEMDGNLNWLSTNLSGSNVIISGSTELSGSLKVTSKIISDSLLISSSANAIETAPKFKIGHGGDYFYIWPGTTAGTTQLLMRGNNPLLYNWYYSIETNYNITHTAGGYVDNMYFNMGSNNAITLKGSGNVIMGGSTDTTLYKLDVLSKDARINGLRIGKGPNNQIENTVVGELAFNSNLIGTRNTAVGFEALYSNTSGRFNTAYGMDASYFNSVGEQNVAIGYSALQSNRSGSFNTILGGSNTAYEITSGSYNTILGTNSGRTITIGNNNTIIGGRLNNSYTPGAPFTTTMSDNVILGDGKGYIRYRFDGTKNNFYDSIIITGSVTATQGFTGSLFGTASQATALQNTGSIGFVSNMSDTYTGTAKITDIITLSAAEYAAIGSPLTSTLYVII